MNFFKVEVLVIIAVIVVVDGNPIKYYATKYDHLDVEEVLNNKRMVKYYANCLLSKGPCTPQGTELKKILPEALETNCQRCTEKQKAVTYRSIKRLKKEYPKTWELLQANWDPNNIYVKRFEESFNQKSSPSVPENEIIVIENRFGDSDDDLSKPSTTVKIETQKPKLTTVTVRSSTEESTLKSSRRPSINSIASASENKPSSVPQNVSIPQYPGVNVTNQVGSGNQEEDGNKKQISSHMNSVKTPSTSVSTTASTISSTSSSLTQSYSHVDSTKVTFDIPLSSINHPQTQKILTQNSGTTVVPKDGKGSVTVTEKIPKSNRQRDPISQLVFSFLNANRPRTSAEPTTSTTSQPESPNLQIRLPKISGLIRKAGVRNRSKLEANATVQVSLRRPLIQVGLPGVIVNNQIEGFNPVGNIVRGLANAGDRLIETGSSIADSVLTSVRGLFNPNARRNRSLRRN